MNHRLTCCLLPFLALAALVMGSLSSSPAHATASQGSSLESSVHTLGVVSYPAASAAHYAPPLVEGWYSCLLAVDRYGHRSPTHRRGSFVDRHIAVRTCRVAVEVAHKLGLPHDAVAYGVAAWGIQESNWAVAAFGSNSEVGPLQIKRRTCRDVLSRDCTYKDDLVTVLRASLLYIDYMHQFGITWMGALSAYRVGPGGWMGVRRCVEDPSTCTPIDRSRSVSGRMYADSINTRMVWLRSQGG